MQALEGGGRRFQKRITLSTVCSQPLRRRIGPVSQFLQNAVAIAISLAAAAWLCRTIRGRIASPGCGPPMGPAGADGFVPLEAITPPQTPSGGAQHPS
ncbi:MAG: hypothetical protein DWH79_13275 [Planctomycetota bacterium]|nr:MAG: hypothetical protein DWH79_13275 [Planctomycetota bacterium]